MFASLTLTSTPTQRVFRFAFLRIISETEIPDQVKRAQIELAVYLKNNTDGISLSGLNDFKNVQIGSLNVTPDKTGAVGADHVPPMFERYLTGLRISGPGNIAIKRELTMYGDFSGGFEFISDTNAHTGRFQKIYFKEDTVISAITVKNATGNSFGR